MRLVTGLSVALILGTGSAAMAQVAETTFVPVVVNLYAGSGTTEQDARDAIKAANEILKQAGAKLVVVKVNNPPANNGGDDGSGGGAAGDGIFTGAERDKARKFGQDEIDGLPGKKGVKISFGLTPVAPPHPAAASPGVALHHNPTMIVKKGAQAGGPTGTGSTIAHEFSHIMTLDIDHLIDPGPPPIKAGATDAHAPNTPGDNGNGNLMAGSNTRTGTKLTQSQIDEIKKRLCGAGWCSAQFDRNFPAEKERHDYGTKSDPLGDDTGSTRLYDLDRVELSSMDQLSNVDAILTVAEPLPQNQQINATYEVGLDIDASSSTGTSFAGISGIDRIVRVIASGNVGLGTFQLSGEVRNTITSTITPLPIPPAAETEYELPSLGSATPAQTSFLCKIPKSLLSLSATDVPAVAAAGDGAQIFDTATFTYDTTASEDLPTLQTQGTGVPTPGASYPFQISGLTPSTPFSLFLDETLVLASTTNNQGSFAGSFVFPSNVPNATLHFLTAQDTTGRFAYSLTCPDLTGIPALSIPGVVIMAALLAASALVTLWRRAA